MFITECVDRLADGLTILGVLNAIQRHADAMRPFFVHTEDEVLTADTIFQLYTPLGLSAEGSNRRRKEDQTVSWWRDFVLDVEGRVIYRYKFKYCL